MVFNFVWVYCCYIWRKESTKNSVSHIRGMSVRSEKGQTFYLHWKTTEARKYLSILKSVLCKMSQIYFVLWWSLCDELQACSYMRCFVEQPEKVAALKVRKKYVWLYQSVRTCDRQSQGDLFAIGGTWTGFSPCSLVLPVLIFTKFLCVLFPISTINSMWP
jgi:hypothetical protein